jgi:anaerobic selenocysteine-containing dehydrogenase
VLIPAAAWAEKDGCWENFAGKLQHFDAAVPPPEGVRRDGNVYLALLGRGGLYNAQTIRYEMGSPFSDVKPPEIDTKAAASMEFVAL